MPEGTRKQLFFFAKNFPTPPAWTHPLRLVRDGYSRAVDLSDPASCEVGRLDCSFKRDRDDNVLKISACAARLSRRGVGHAQVAAVKAPLKVRTPHGG